MTVQIQPIQVLGKTGITTGVTLDVRVIGYNLDNKGCNTVFEVRDEDGHLLYDGNKTVPASVVKDWAADDTVIVRDVAQQLGLTIINS